MAHGRRCGTDAALEKPRSQHDRHARARKAPQEVASKPSEASIVRRLRALAQRMGYLAIKTHGSQFSVAGFPDLLFFRDGRAWAGEVKRPGKSPSAVQVACMQRLERHGIPCATIRNEDDLCELLRRA
jgi:hypothetical protein